VEGLVKLETIGFGGKLDKMLHALVFPDGRRIRVGQKCRVRLASVSPERRQMDFEPLEIEGKTVTRRERVQRPGRPGWQPTPRFEEEPRRERSAAPGRRLGQWRPDEEAPRLGVVSQEPGARRGRREEPREEPPKLQEKRRRFVRAGQWEEAAPSKADRKHRKGERGTGQFAESRRPEPREESPEQAGGTRRRRFVVRPVEQAERETEAPRSSWNPEAPPLAEGDPLAAFMADAPPPTPPPGFDRLRALAARSGRKGEERRYTEAPSAVLERPSREAREKRPARKATPGGKKASRAAPSGKRKGAQGGGKPPKSGGKFKPGRRGH
jgi:ribonuclease R